jgi:DNA-binding transcriptional regulator YiaG
MLNRQRGYDSLFLQKVEDADQTPVVMLLADICINKGIPMAEVAHFFGVTRATVYNWMTGRTVPHPRHRAVMPKIISRLSKRK